MNRIKSVPRDVDTIPSKDEISLRKVDATRHWNTIFTAYNKVAREKVDPDLASWVTTRALEGLFVQLADEERLIRMDPIARSTDHLRRVFRQ